MPGIACGHEGTHRREAKLTRSVVEDELSLREQRAVGDRVTASLICAKVGNSSRYCQVRNIDSIARPEQYVTGNVSAAFP
jgi:hypothetical protein